jgi:hypothetical protein
LFHSVVWLAGTESIHQWFAMQLHEQFSHSSAVSSCCCCSIIYCLFGRKRVSIHASEKDAHQWFTNNQWCTMNSHIGSVVLIQVVVVSYCLVNRNRISSMHQRIGWTSDRFTKEWWATNSYISVVLLLLVLVSYCQVDRNVISMHQGFTDWLTEIDKSTSMCMLQKMIQHQEFTKHMHKSLLGEDTLRKCYGTIFCHLEYMFFLLYQKHRVMRGMVNFFSIILSHEHCRVFNIIITHHPMRWHYWHRIVIKLSPFNKIIEFVLFTIWYYLVCFKK